MENVDYVSLWQTISEMTLGQLEAARKYFEARSCLPLTGRYGDVNDVFKCVASEGSLMGTRVYVEIKFLLTFLREIGVKISKKKVAEIENISCTFSLEDYFIIKSIEQKTRHDVKAVEYFIQDKLKEIGMDELIPYIHIGCTSEDINNLAYALTANNLSNIWLDVAEKLIDEIYNLSIKTKDVPMLGHTHGQPATALTFGHAMCVYWNRLKYSFAFIENLSGYLKGKFNGAVGNMSAISVAYPDHDWMSFSEMFVEDVLGLSYNPITSQIESHDSIVRLINELNIFNSIVEDISRNIWMYISIKYLKQVVKEGEVGSSTMPQKVNPIDAENAWGNAHMSFYSGLALTTKLPFSVMQRDLSDSTTLRNIAQPFMSSYQAISSLLKMLSRIEVNKEEMKKDLDENPEILAEAIQTVLRANGVSNAYEIMKGMVRGKKVSLDEIREFIKTLDIKEEDKQRLLSLTPEYTGYSKQIVEKYCEKATYSY